MTKAFYKWSKVKWMAPIKNWGQIYYDTNKFIKIQGEKRQFCL